MTKKIVLYCPNSRIHTHRDGLGVLPEGKRPHRIQLIIDENCLYTYCSDTACRKDRGSTWLKVELLRCGKPISFQDIAIRTKEMPKGYNFNLDKIPILTEMAHASSN